MPPKFDHGSPVVGLVKQGPSRPIARAYSGNGCYDNLLALAQMEFGVPRPDEEETKWFEVVHIYHKYCREQKVFLDMELLLPFEEEAPCLPW